MRRKTRGSVLIIVMVSLLFATFAVLAFMEKASVDLLVERREVLTNRLRAEAYSALEVTLGVLEEFREVGNGLHSPAEGWTDPLGFASYTPAEGRVVEISFEDESGKISLPKATAQTLTLLFQNWGLTKPDAEALADAMLGWMKRNHIYTTSIIPKYDSAAVPFEPPGRSMRSYHELAAIEKAREVFYDRDGRPNALWKRFVDSVSLLDFQRPNINGAKPDTLAALGQFNETQQQNIGEYLAGKGAHMNTGPGYFQNANDAQRIAGGLGDTGGFGTTISALRIHVTVRDGRTEYRMSTVIAPIQGGATAVTTNATATRTETSAARTSPTAAQQQNRPNAQQPNPRPGVTKAGGPANPPQAGAAAPSLKYPFNLLEIAENDEIPSGSPLSVASGG